MATSECAAAFPDLYDLDYSSRSWYAILSSIPSWKRQQNLMAQNGLFSNPVRFAYACFDLLYPSLSTMTWLLAYFLSLVVSHSSKLSSQCNSPLLSLSLLTLRFVVVNLVHKCILEAYHSSSKTAMFAKFFGSLTKFGWWTVVEHVLHAIVILKTAECALARRRVFRRSPNSSRMGRRLDQKWNFGGRSRSTKLYPSWEFMLR